MSTSASINAASALDTSGQTEEAESLLEETAASYTTVLGADDLNTIATSKELADLKHKTGDLVVSVHRLAVFRRGVSQT